MNDMLQRGPQADETASTDAPAASGWAAVAVTWSDRGRIEALAVAALPPLVFVGVAAAGPLVAALVAALAASLLAAAYRLLRHDGLRSAVVGLLITVACAAVAAATGQARGFFLLPAMVPFAVILVCVATMIVRRPLTGLVLNRVSGGPRDWYRRPRVLRVHLLATGACVAVNVVNGVVQVVFYAAGDTLVLAAAHIATGPVFATIVAVTLVFARRAIVSGR